MKVPCFPVKRFDIWRGLQDFLVLKKSYFILRMGRSIPHWRNWRKQTGAIIDVCWIESHSTWHYFLIAKQQKLVPSVIGHTQNGEGAAGGGWKSQIWKAISCAVEYFNTYDLDAFFLVTNAPVVHSTELTEEWLLFAKSWVLFYLSTNILERIWMTKETELIHNLNWKTLNKLERL